MYPRETIAYQKYTKTLSEQLRAHNLTLGCHVMLQVYKWEKSFEIWVKTDSSWVLLEAFSFSKRSGRLGPKRKEGDRQIPEGIYLIRNFNPNSKFLLSMGLNYPNEADKYWAGKTSLGGDIFIHGGTQSKGCIAITNKRIQPLYVLCQEAYKNGQLEIPVYIFPFKFNQPYRLRIFSRFAKRPPIIQLWQQLIPIFHQFITNPQSLPTIDIKQGEYRLITT